MLDALRSPRLKRAVNLNYVLGDALMRLPAGEADVAFAKLQAGKPQLVVTGETVAVLFADGTPFTFCNIHELT